MAYPGDPNGGGQRGELLPGRHRGGLARRRGQLPALVRRPDGDDQHHLRARPHRYPESPGTHGPRMGRSGRASRGRPRSTAMSPPTSRWGFATVQRAPSPIGQVRTRRTLRRVAGGVRGLPANGRWGWRQHEAEARRGQPAGGRHRRAPRCHPEDHHPVSSTTGSVFMPDTFDESLPTRGPALALGAQWEEPLGPLRWRADADGAPIVDHVLRLRGRRRGGARTPRWMTARSGDCSVGFCNTVRRPDRG